MIYKNDDNELVNPLDLIAQARIIQWSMIPIDQMFEFELLCYYKSQMIPYGRGGYIFLASRSIKDYKKAQIETDETMIIQFAYKAFYNALALLPVRVKQSCTRSKMEIYDDLYIKFKKIDKKHMVIYDIQRRAGDTTNVGLVDGMYKVI